MLTRGFILLLVVVAGQVHSARADFAVLGVGADSCASWTKNSKNPFMNQAQLLWVEGFLSGLAQGTRRDLLKNVDQEAIDRWMSSYCAQHPLDRVFDAMAPLWLDLLKRQNP